MCFPKQRLRKIQALEKRKGRSARRPGEGIGRCGLYHTQKAGEAAVIDHKNPAKAFLLRYRALQGKCAALERAINTALENATNTTVALKEICVQTSGGGDMMANAVVSALDATKMLEEQRQEAAQIMCEIMDAIKSVPDDVQQTILIERYINGRLLQDIQNDIHYEKRNTIILHGRALWEVWQYMKRKGLCE